MEPPCRWKWSCTVWPGRALRTSRQRGRIGSWALQIKFLLTCSPRSTCNGTSVQMEVVLHRVAGQGAAHLTAAGTYRLMGASDKIPPDVLAAQHVQWNLHGTFALDDMHVR